MQRVNANTRQETRREGRERPGFQGLDGRIPGHQDWLAESRIRTLTMAAEFALLLRDRFACHFIGVKPN